MPAETFSPSRIVRSPHLQSVLASSGIRRWLLRLRGADLDPAATEHLLDCGEGVRLQGFFSPAPAGSTPRGLVILLHGWEGCHRSSYVVSTGSSLRGRGYQVFRLNFRDHGDTHHLNEELFHSCRLAEVIGAVRAIAERFSTRPLFLVGFSLGGNFALRVAAGAAAARLPMDHVVAVSPVVDPAHTLEMMENGARLYERYFARKWRRSLVRKQELFPERYDFTEWMRIDGLREKTRFLVGRYGFESLEAYLEGYSIAGSRLADLRLPATIITASDDPVNPVEDFRRIEVSARTRLEIQQHGGHSGFVDGLAMNCWADRRIASILDEAASVSACTDR